MDSSWGIVIVSVVGTVGTVIGVMLTNRHSERLATAQRLSEAKAYRREGLSTAFRDYMAVISQLDVFFDLTGTAEQRDTLRRQLEYRETELSVAGDEGVGAAARSLTVTYGPNQPMGPPFNPEVRGLKDALVAAVRGALLEA